MADLAIIKSSTLTDIADAIRAKKGEATSNTLAQSDYVQIDYIESTGTQYIDTEYKFTTDKTRVRMVVENLNTTGNHALCGSENSGFSGNIDDVHGWLSPTLFSYANDGPEVFKLNICGSAWIVENISIPKGSRHTIEIETFGDGNGKITLDGIETSFIYQGHVENQYSFYIFATNLIGVANGLSTHRVHEFQMWDDDVFVRDYVACRHRDGSVGLFDKINETLSCSPNGETFIASVTEIGSIGTGDGTVGYRLIQTTSMANEILSIEAAGELPTLNTPASSYHILSGYEAIDTNGSKITGVIPTLGVTSYTPGVSEHTFSGGSYLANDLIIAGDINLSSGNIKDGVTIFGIEGNYVGNTIDESVDLSRVTAVASDVRNEKIFVNSSGDEVTGTIPTRDSSSLTAFGAIVTVPAGIYDSQANMSVATATQATPIIDIDPSGLITASATQAPGYVSAGTKSETKQLSTKAADTIIPTTSSQTAVASGVYTTGNIIVAGDSNLVASNIRSGASIFGVSGSYKGIKFAQGTATGAASGLFIALPETFQYVFFIRIENTSSSNGFTYLVLENYSGAMPVDAFSGRVFYTVDGVDYTDNLENCMSNRWIYCTMGSNSLSIRQSGFTGVTWPSTFSYYIIGR